MTRYALPPSGAVGRARAPGKLVVSGAYAVLEGAPAIVVAVDRFAFADASRIAEQPSAEVRHAFGDRAPQYDGSAFALGGKKVGLGSSAAVLVASLGAALASRGAALDSASVREEIFTAARTAHAEVQGGGSGIDVAASTYGGVLRYALDGRGKAAIAPTALPDGICVRVFFSGKSVRTSDMLGRVGAFRARAVAEHRVAMRTLCDRAEAASGAVSSGDGAMFVTALQGFAEQLQAFGDAADAPIVPRALRDLAAAAATEQACFLPSGAGGGDVALFVGVHPPSDRFMQIASDRSLVELSLAVTHVGVSSWS
jgi:phosphomevalonate kinase